VQTSDFTVHVSGFQQSPDTFPGSEEVTDVKIGAGNYQVTEEPPNRALSHIRTTFSQDCSGVIHSNEDKTCTINNTIAQ
jgi:hypothetical protein